MQNKNVEHLNITIIISKSEFCILIGKKVLQKKQQWYAVAVLSILHDKRSYVQEIIEKLKIFA